MRKIMNRKYFGMVLMVLVGTGTVDAQMTKKAVKDTTPRIGSRVKIKKFVDPVTRSLGGMYGITDISHVTSIVFHAKDKDAEYLKDMVKDNKLVMLPTGTTAQVLGFDQMTFQTLDAAFRNVQRVRTKSDPSTFEKPDNVGPPMAQVRVLDGPQKGAVLLVPIVYLALLPDKP
jgi:hypothetical protein